jgi:ferredoxin-NADP reductase
VALLTLPIRDVRVETPRTRTVFVSLSGGLVDYCAGQSVWVGGHGQRFRKPYSIACTPERARIQDALELLIQVGADGRAGPHLDSPAAEMLVDVDGPTGTFCFPDHPREPRFLFIAGGTGIAPLRAILWHALRAFPDREMALFYSARSADEFAYGDELRQLERGRRLVLRETVTREAGPPWAGARGRLTPARIASMLAPQPTLCFVCGPPGFVEDVTSWLRDLGVTEERIMAEGW